VTGSAARDEDRSPSSVGQPAVGQSSSGQPADRFPGFDVMSQARHWDPVTARLLRERTGPQPELAFFTPAEFATATALVDQILGQQAAQLVPAARMIDSRLAAGQTDGWRYADMPEDGQAWRNCLAWLDADAEQKFGRNLTACSAAERRALVQAVQDLGGGDWHGLVAAHVWSLWTRYACTAFYSHPLAWNEIGFPGPAYPRGYKNAGTDSREPFEVRDARPADDPVRSGG
jgi:hypothetical protein